MLLRKIRRFLNNRFFRWREKKKNIVVGIVITKSKLILPRVLKKKVKSNRIYFYSVIEKDLMYSFEEYNKWDEKLLDIEDLNTAIDKLNIIKPHTIYKKSEYIYLEDVWNIEKFYPCSSGKFYI